MTLKKISFFDKCNETLFQNKTLTSANTLTEFKNLLLEMRR